jgi:hypothetical protein
VLQDHLRPAPRAWAAAANIVTVKQNL